jgi:hypothetical protein
LGTVSVDRFEKNDALNKFIWSVSIKVCMIYCVNFFSAFNHLKFIMTLQTLGVKSKQN